MKNNKMKQLVLTMLALIFVFGTAWSQDEEKIKPRLSVNFEQNGTEYTVITKARARIGKRFQSLSKVPVNVYQLIDDEEFLLGSGMSDHNGVAKVMLPENLFEKADTSGLVYLEARVENAEKYKDSSSDIEVGKAEVEFDFEVVEQGGKIMARLMNATTKEPVSEMDVAFYQVGYIRNLTLGDDYYTTDTLGYAEVKIPADLKADFDGNIKLGVRLEDHEVFGTVKSENKVAFGIPAIKDNSFNERNMWSTADKTPLWLLIFPNLLILGVWGVLIFLAYKLYLIYRN